MYDLDRLRHGLDILGCPYDNDKIYKLIKFYEMLVEKNKVMNLTTVTDFDEVVSKHFLDSLSLAVANDFLTENNISLYIKNRLIDVGTGAGFPGIPISIFFEDFEVVLLDSLNKRINFLKDVCEALCLTNVTCIHSRSEDLARDGKFREKFDLVTSRAVAKLPVLFEYTLPFLRKNGILVAYKGPDVCYELISGEKAAGILGGQIINKIDFKLPDSDDNRSFVLVRKEQKTPKLYPRKAGTASKLPLGL